MRQVFVTGASSDIGLAVCRLYLSRGYRVLAHHYRGRPAFDALWAESPDLTPIRIDLGNPDDLGHALSEHRETVAATDVFIHAAAHMEPLSFADATAETVWRAMMVNAVSAVLVMQAVVPSMVERGWGRIVLLGSIGVKYGGGTSSFCYAYGKHALEFMPGEHRAWAARDVLVNVLRLGVTDTRIHRADPGKDMTARVARIPAGRMAEPDEMARAVHWFGSEENTFTTGQVVAIAGGE